MTFADKLKELRQTAGMTQVRLSEASGVPLPTIRDYEQGKREPLLSNAYRLARALGVSLDALPADELTHAPSPATPKPKARSRKAKKK